MSAFNNPQFATHGNPDGSQNVTVSFKSSGGYPNVNISFRDHPAPNETNAAEQSRWRAKAKELLTQAAATC